MSDFRPLQEIARLMYARQEYHLGGHVEHWSREFEKLAAENERLRHALTYIAQGGNTVPVGTEYVKHLESFARKILDQSPSSAPAEPVKTTRLYGGEYHHAKGCWLYCVGKKPQEHDTHYIDIAEDGAIVGGKLR